MLLKKLCNYKIVIDSQTLLLILHFVKVNIIANTTGYVTVIFHSGIAAQAINLTVLKKLLTIALALKY